jgi:hypothetical protein
MIEYTPYDWFWQIGDDQTRYWSSAAGSYVTTKPDIFTRIVSEADLAEVLRPYGIVGPVVTPQDVKAEAQRRIYERYPEWKQANLLARGVELQDAWRVNGEWTAEEAADAQTCRDAWDWIKSVRDASDAIEATAPIPRDYRSDQYWPE